MESDPASLKRIIAFVELLQRARRGKIKPTSVTTPTEQGDNIHVVVTIDGKRLDAGLFFWDISFLQAKGLLDTLDDDDITLGMTIIDGIVDETKPILAFAENELKKLSNG
mgnify:CR=1 FL=1